MKSTIYIRLIINLLLVIGGTYRIEACGPYYPLIPTPDFFTLHHYRSLSDYERSENLQLWQSQTSARIPLADIEEVVYRDSRGKVYDHTGYDAQMSSNLFYAYLKNANDDEAVEFLLTAKELEEQRRDIQSPWYYPRNRTYGVENGDFSQFIEYCKEYDGKRFKDRYSLQITRALFASRQYAECIEFVDSAFEKTPDNSLMKRMAQNYIAGCWSRLGDTLRADSIFAKTGDILSVKREDRAEYMAQYNPNAPQLMDYIRCNAADTAFMLKMIPVAKHLLKNNRVKCKGDWHFMLAFANNEYLDNVSVARQEMIRAINGKFSSKNLQDLARAYKMKLDGMVGNSGSLLSDLKWIISKMDILNPEAREWVRRCQNIIYVDWIPRLWKHNDYSTAILLCSFADNLAPFQQLPLVRNNENIDKQIYYGSLSFQLMGSLTSDQLACTYRKLLSDEPLYNFLRHNSCTHKDYYYELIGTLALREENYDRAIQYLSKVSRNYLSSMPIDSYLSRDPFVAYRTRWEKFEPHEDCEEPIYYESSASWHSAASKPKTKLDFARKMLSLKQKMTSSPTADERGIARLKYSIGRRNSFEECWALTQYWRGWIDKFEPSLQYWENDFMDDNYSFLYDYLTSVGFKNTEELYKKEVAASLAMLTTDEARAKANYILGNLATVIKHYNNTSTARFIKTSCDNWKSWL